MLASILVLFVIPFINTSFVRNTSYRPIFKFCFWFFIADFVNLTWVGQQPVKDVFVTSGNTATYYYFAFFLIFIPVVGKIETYLVLYTYLIVYYFLFGWPWDPLACKRSLMVFVIVTVAIDIQVVTGKIDPPFWYPKSKK